jgi:hypothetical protein
MAMTSISPTWKVLGSSVIGTSHLRHGLPCQDAHGTLFLPNNVVALAVADGAGSAGRAQEGSRIATTNSLEFIERHLSLHIPQSHAEWETLLRDAIWDSRRTLEISAGDGNLCDLATTLLLAVATPDTLAVAQVGDGAIVYRDVHGLLHVLTTVEDREYINETSFLTGSALQNDVVCTVLTASEIDAIAIFSDGIQHLAIEYPTNIAHPPFFNPLFAFVSTEDADPRELDALLSSPQVNERTDDDKSLVLAVRNAIL